MPEKWPGRRRKEQVCIAVQKGMTLKIYVSALRVQISESTDFTDCQPHLQPQAIQGILGNTQSLGENSRLFKHSNGRCLLADSVSYKVCCKQTQLPFSRKLLATLSYLGWVTLSCLLMSGCELYVHNILLFRSIRITTGGIVEFLSTSGAS